MIVLIILFTPLLSSSNTWLQKQCIRKYIMIIIISANKFFINGIRSLVNMTMSAQRRYSQTLFLDNISDVNDKSLTIARTIIVDYSHPDIQQLAALLYRKKKIIHGDIVFVVKSEILADPVENIIINSISTIVLDYIDVTQRLQKYLQMRLITAVLKCSENQLARWTVVSILNLRNRRTLFSPISSQV